MVPEEVAGHGRRQKGQRTAAGRHLDRSGGIGIEAGDSLFGDHQWNRIVRLEDGDLLDRVGDHLARHADGTDYHQGLTREIDVLLVFEVVDRDWTCSTAR